jgi:predicted ABC-type ATPase
LVRVIERVVSRSIEYLDHRLLVHPRVAAGGHNVLEDVIRRRFDAGLRNFSQVYKPLVDEWVLYDNSGDEPVRLGEGYRS